MSSLLHPLGAEDVDDMLALNERNVELLAPMDAARLRYFDEAATVEVVRHEHRFAGFVITIDSGHEFDSENYAWFGRRYDSFCYLDRIVLHENARRLGLGRRVYDEVEARAAGTGLLTLEVNIDPPNEASLAFHRGRGFEQVGERLITDHTVAMMVKRLSR